MFGESYWGKGYASEVLIALIQYHKTQSNIRTLYTGVESGNIASIKVLEKCGFELNESEMAQEDNLFYELWL